MSGDHEETVPLMEPDTVPCLFLTGMGIEPGPHVFRYVGWVRMPDFGGEFRERRIVQRFTMPIDATRQLLENLRKTVRGTGRDH